MSKSCNLISPEIFRIKYIKYFTNLRKLKYHTCFNFRKHHTLMDNNAQSKRYKRERAHMDEFCEWFRDEIRKKTNVSRELASLAKGPRREAKRFSGYIVNGYRFHTKQRDRKCTIQNSGVYLTALTTSFANAKDSDPLVGEVSYYGSIEEIVEVDYWGAFRVVLFLSLIHI